MAKQTVKSRFNYEVQVKICNTMLLHPKEGQIIVISTGLQEIEPIHDKGQDTITLNWESYQQIKRNTIFQ